MDALLKRYAPALLPAFAAVVGIFTALGDANLGALTDWRTWVQVGIVLLTSAAIYVLKLLPTGWRGGFKVGAPILAAVLTAAVAAVPTGEPLNKANLILVGTAVVKVMVTWLGVAIRLEPVKIDARTTAAGAVPVITALGTHDALEEGDGLSNPANAAPAADVPKHLAAS